jgi:hypothetical protein
MRCVEDALREIRDKAVIEYLAECAAESQRVAENHVFGGIGSLCEEIGTLADRVKRALDVEALGRELRPR